MLSKLALAVKTKTIEFFAEEDDDDDDASLPAAAADAVLHLATAAAAAPPEEVITGQRVVVLKPDAPRTSDLQTLAAAALATVSSFHAAYLLLQTAHSPLRSEAVRSADCAAVSFLRRLSDLKHSYFHQRQSPNHGSGGVPLSSHLESQVQENLGLLRTFETVVSRLQSDIDRKDAEAADLELRLQELEVTNSRLSDRLERACMPVEEKVEALLSIGVFDSVLRETCRITHRFARILVNSMKKSGFDLALAANSVHPNVNYDKAGHCRYAILSYVCLGMFEGFDSYDFHSDGTGIGLDEIDITIRRNDSLQQFIEQSALDALMQIRDYPSCNFAKFCEKKYKELIHPAIESSFLGHSENGSSLLSSFRSSSPLYEPFVSMASSIWTLHKLAWAYDPVVEIFQVAQGTKFSMVFMESIVRHAKDKMGMDNRKKWESKPEENVSVNITKLEISRSVISSRQIDRLFRYFALFLELSMLIPGYNLDNVPLLRFPQSTKNSWCRMAWHDLESTSLILALSKLFAACM